MFAVAMLALLLGTLCLATLVVALALLALAVVGGPEYIDRERAVRNMKKLAGGTAAGVVSCAVLFVAAASSTSFD